MIKENDSMQTKSIIWISSVLRWILGSSIACFGYLYRHEEKAWVAIVFGLLLIATGFIRPKRCIEDKCKI